MAKGIGAVVFGAGGAAVHGAGGDGEGEFEGAGKAGLVDDLPILDEPHQQVGEEGHREGRRNGRPGLAFQALPSSVADM